MGPKIFGGGGAMNPNDAMIFYAVILSVNSEHEMRETDLSVLKKTFLIRQLRTFIREKSRDNLI